MAKGPRYRVPYRRRRQGKTDYRLRRKLILSRLPRLVVRGSLKHTTVQLVKSEVMGDKDLLKDYGWKGNCGNLPAAYLTGLLGGWRAASRGIKEAILDIGLQSPSKESRVFAALRGFMDAGIDIPHDEGILPDDARIDGRHIADYAGRLASSDKELYARMFSKYLSAGLIPEEVPKHFAEVKEKIISTMKHEG